MRARYGIPRPLKAVEVLLVAVAVSATAFAGAAYQAGKLVSITDSRSNRAMSNSQNGSVVTVTDVEYRISVQIGGMTYVGSYWPRTVWSYSPTDFIVNDPVQVKIDGKYMYIKRPDGKELKNNCDSADTGKPQPLATPARFISRQRFSASEIG